jgi:hypothetical protein
MIIKTFKFELDRLEEVYINVDNIMHFTFMQAVNDTTPEMLGIKLDKFVLATFVNGDKMALAMPSTVLNTLRG